MATPATSQSSVMADQILSLTSATTFPKLYHPNSPKKSNNFPIEPILPSDESNYNATDVVLEDKPSGKHKYEDLIKHVSLNSPQLKKGDQANIIMVKKPTFNNGVPRITWTEEEVHNMNIIENLQYAIIEKFSYRWLELEDLKVQIPK